MPFKRWATRNRTTSVRPVSRPGLWVAVLVTGLIAASLGYDRAIEQASTTRAMLTARHAKCGPVTNSGPKEPQWARTRKTYYLMARLSDGQLVRVERQAQPLPDCGATLEIAERVTPWGTVWYSTKQ
jgi:hypothetical protein